MTTSHSEFAALEEEIRVTRQELSGAIQRLYTELELLRADMAIMMQHNNDALHILDSQHQTRMERLSANFQKRFGRSQSELPN